MKRSLTIMCGILLLAGCVEENYVQSENGDGSLYEVQLFNEIRQTPVTRVNDEGFCDKDAVGIYVVNYVDGSPGQLHVSGNQADNIKYTYNEADGRWTPATSVYYKDKKTHVDIYGYYPYSAPASIESFQFEVQKDQSKDAADGSMGGYESSDFLWGKAEDITPTASRVNLSFHHIMSSVSVSLVEGTGFADGEFAMVDKEVLVTNTKRQAIIDLSAGKVEATGDNPVTGTIPYKRDGDFRAVVVPQTIPASTALFSLTVDGISYIFRKSTEFGYLPGKLHKFSIEVSKKTVGGLEFKLLGESIVAWEADNISHDGTAREYVIVECPEGGKLKETIIAEGKDFSKIKNLKVTGKIDASDFFFMRDEMTVLQSINLKEVEIVAGKGNYTDSGANEIPNYAFSEKSSLLRFIFPEKLCRIGRYSFHSTNISGSLIIPEGVVEIGECAFKGCNSLNGKLTLPKSLTKICYGAFWSCSNLFGELNIPNNVIEIGVEAFDGCANFTGNLILPKSLKQLGIYSFYGCSGLTGSLIIPPEITEIPNCCFSYCSGLNGILILPESITIIGDYCFSHCGFRGELNLPENMTVIGESAFSSNNFSGKLIIPESVTVVKNGAFSFNKRLTGTVKLPDELSSVASETFAGCHQLEGVILPKYIEYIGEGAFRDCFQLNSITCLAQNPPALAADAFNGVAKDNFTVEVPEASVSNYITAPVWKEFKRFAANRDFSISRNLFRTLNAELSKTFVLRAPAGESWSVESCPDWVSVSPSSGTGKTDVTVTVSAQAKGAGCRSSVVSFLLDGKDYRSSMTVEQYDYQYGDGEVLTIQEAGKGAGVNLVFMGDCFDAKDIYDGKYYDSVNEAIGYFFAVEPYKTYKDYFNVYMVFGLSPDSGVGSVNTIREAKFGSAYALGGICPDENVCFEYACKAPIDGNVSNTLITLIENTSEYGGITYMWGDGSAIACCPISEEVYPYDFRGLVQHEVGGHGFGKLGDEYIYHNAFIQTCKCSCCSHVDKFNVYKSRGWYENLSLTGNMSDVPWSHMIFDPQFSNVVDIYEGGYMHMRGVFRSEPNSCMNNNIPYYSAISREAIVKRIKQYAGESYSYEDFKALDVALPETRSLAKGAGMPIDTYYQSARQHAPKYMGDRPSFKK